MKINQLGEFGLINLIEKSIGSYSGVVKGIGDDCAVIPASSKRFMLLATDMLVEGVDFTPDDNPYWIGHKSIGVCLSDIAACAGMPVYAQVCLGLPPKMPVNRFRQLYRGIISHANAFEVKIVGGDISRAEKLVIATSLVGFVQRHYLVLRQGARSGDIIFVSGQLGGSIYGKHLRFTPRLRESRFLAQNYKVNSMIDISDGLIQDLGHILKQSNKGAVIFQNLIPVSPQAKTFNEALCMGEDFELLFTLAASEAHRLLRLSKNSRIDFQDGIYRQMQFTKGSLQFSPIGRIVDKSEGLVLCDQDGRKKRLSLGKGVARLKKGFRGFKHF